MILNSRRKTKNWFKIRKLEKEKNKKSNWVICLDCKGIGKKKQRIRKNVRLEYQKALNLYEKSNGRGTAPIKPIGLLQICSNCKGTGLILSFLHPLIDSKNYPHIAIIGGGIGGVALAVACLHRGIPFTLYERDASFNTRSQGYGLTLQQASKAMAGLGILSLKEGITSTRHVVHTSDGKIIGEWGIRKWGRSETKKAPKRTNIHIARQSLRLALLEELGGHESVKWGHQLLSFNEIDNESVQLKFQVNNEIKEENKNIDLSSVLSSSKNEKKKVKEKNNSLEKSISNILNNN